MLIKPQFRVVSELGKKQDLRHFPPSWAFPLGLL